MARRGQLRGERRPAPVVARGRSPVPRWQAEQKRQRLAMAVGAAVLLFILALPIWGYITTFVIPPRKVVANVNGTTITLRDLLKNLRVLQRGAEATGQTLDMSQLPFNILNTLVEDEIIRQKALQLGITVGTEEVDKEVRTRFLGATTTETDPQVLETDLKERLRRYLNFVQISDEEYRKQLQAELLRAKATEAVGREVSPIQPQVHLYQLTVANEEVLKKVQELAEVYGTPFDDLVKQYEANERAKAAGGELGWFPKGVLGPNADIIFDLQEGKLSDPGTREDGSFVLLSVKERAAAREVEKRQLESLKSQALTEWINTQRQEQEITTNFSSAQYDWVVKQLGSSARSQQARSGQ
ncbi:MAG: hypothetical protein EXR55_04845 [Dehalococcoidia bacterium]|nr:hypothetical protein [Dehalococcoidia bacterium]